MQTIPESDSNWLDIHPGLLGAAPTCEPDLQIPQSRASLWETAEGSDGHQPDSEHKGSLLILSSCIIITCANKKTKKTHRLILSYARAA